MTQLSGPHRRRKSIRRKSDTPKPGYAEVFSPGDDKKMDMTE